MKAIPACFVPIQLKFSQYRKAGLTFRKSSGNVLVSGFTDHDLYHEVVTKGAKGLDINVNPANLSLIVSNGLVLDVPLSGDKPWDLGTYVEQIGGVNVSARGKKTFGIYIPFDLEDEEV